MKKDIPIYSLKALSSKQSEDFATSRFTSYVKLHKNLHLAHKHSFYHLLLFTEGSGTHEIDFVSFDIRPGQIYFIIPGQVHRWRFDGHVDGYVINFSVSFFQCFLLKTDYLDQFPYFKGITAPVIDLPYEVETQLKPLFEQILKESEESGLLCLDFIRALMIQLVIMVGRLGLKSPVVQVTSYNCNLIRKFLRLIETNVGRLKLPKDYAELLFVTTNHLNSLCNNILGKSTGEIIRDRRILEAKRLILNLELPISEISYKLNFKDNSYFSKFFKKYSGLTPEEFRNSAQNAPQRYESLETNIAG